MIQNKEHNIYFNEITKSLTRILHKPHSPYYEGQLWLWKFFDNPTLHFVFSAWATDIFSFSAREHETEMGPLCGFSIAPFLLCYTFDIISCRLCLHQPRSAFIAGLMSSSHDNLNSYFLRRRRPHDAHVLWANKLPWESTRGRRGDSSVTYNYPHVSLPF